MKKYFLFLLCAVCFFASCNPGPSEEELRQQQLELEKKEQEALQKKIKDKKTAAWNAYEGIWYLENSYDYWGTYDENGIFHGKPGYGDKPLNFDTVTFATDSVCLGDSQYSINLDSNVFLYNEIPDIENSVYNKATIFGSHYDKTESGHCELDFPCNCLAISLGNNKYITLKLYEDGELWISVSWVHAPTVVADCDDWADVGFVRKVSTPSSDDSNNDNSNNNDNESVSFDGTYTYNGASNGTGSITLNNGNWNYSGGIMPQEGTYSVSGSVITFKWNKSGYEYEERIQVSNDKTKWKSLDASSNNPSAFFQLFMLAILDDQEVEFRVE